MDLESPKLQKKYWCDGLFLRPQKTLQSLLALGCNRVMTTLQKSLFVLFTLSLCCPAWSMAKTDPPQALPLDGVLRGGSSEGYLSLLDIRRSQNKSQTQERFVLDFGSSTFGPANHGPYYTVEYKNSPPRLIVQLSLVMSTHFLAETMSKKLSPGIFVKSSNMEFDSLSQSHNLVLTLKAPVKVLVSKHDGESGRPARLIVDLLK